MTIDDSNVIWLDLGMLEHAHMDYVNGLAPALALGSFFAFPELLCAN